MELMVVVAIMIPVAAFIASAFTSLERADDVTSAAYAIEGILEQACTGAMANMLFACLFYGKHRFYRLAKFTPPTYP